MFSFSFSKEKHCSFTIWKADIYPEINLFISTEILCVDVINTVNKLEFNEQDKLIIRSLASGFNLFDYYFADSKIGNSSSDEELLNNVSSYCLANPSDPLILSIVTALVGEN